MVIGAQQGKDHNDIQLGTIGVHNPLNLKSDKIRYLYKKLKIMDTKKEKKKVSLDFEKKIYGIPNFVGYQTKWLLTP